MPSSTISLGLGLGGGKSATSSGRPGGTPYANVYSISLDGSDDYMSTPFAPKSIGTGDYSLSFWFKMSASATEDHPYFVVFGADEQATTATYNGVGLTGRSGTGYKVRINNSFGGYTQAVSSSTSDVVAGTWYHFVLTRDGSDLILYKNGSSFLTLSNAAVGNNDLADGDDLRIGYGYGAGSLGRNVYGNMDEFAVFGSVLSAAQVTNIYKGEESGGSGGTNGVPGDLSTFSPLGWWRMGENNGGSGTTITDQGSGENNGTLENGPTYSPAVPPGYSRKSVDFDGTDDYVDIDGVASTIAASNDFSFSAWAKNDGGFGYIFRCSEAVDGTSYKETIGLGIFSDKAYGLLQAEAPYIDYLDSSGTTVNDNAWHHFALTISDSSGTSTLKVYVDGSLAGTASGGITIPDTISVASVGRRPYNSSGSGDLYFGGLIDEVALWNSALSASDVTAIYNSGVPADLDDLNPIGWWRMGDGDTFPTLTDHGSGSNNGTMTNMTSGDIVTDTP